MTKVELLKEVEAKKEEAFAAGITAILPDVVPEKPEELTNEELEKCIDKLEKMIKKAKAGAPGIGSKSRAELLKIAAELKIEGAEAMDVKQLTDNIEAAMVKAEHAAKKAAMEGKKAGGVATGIKALVNVQHKNIEYKAGEEIRDKAVADMLVKEGLAK